jgi:hypothetical protein
MENEVIIQIKLDKIMDDDTTIQVENVATSEYGKLAAKDLMQVLAFILSKKYELDDMEVEEDDK